MSVSYHIAKNVHYSLVNGTILSVSNLVPAPISPPFLSSISSDLLYMFDALFNSNGTTGPPNFPLPPGVINPTISPNPVLPPLRRRQVLDIDSTGTTYTPSPKDADGVPIPPTSIGTTWTPGTDSDPGAFTTVIDGMTDYQISPNLISPRQILERDEVSSIPPPKEPLLDGTLTFGASNSNAGLIITESQIAPVTFSDSTGGVLTVGAPPSELIPRQLDSLTLNETTWIAGAGPNVAVYDGQVFHQPPNPVLPPPIPRDVSTPPNEPLIVNSDSLPIGSLYSNPQTSTIIDGPLILNGITWAPPSSNVPSGVFTRFTNPTVPEYYQNYRRDTGSQLDDTTMKSNLRAFLTLPLLTFQITATIDYSAVNGSVPSLLANLTTTAVYSEAVSRVAIPLWTVIVYSVVMVMVYGWWIACLCYARVRFDCPKLTEFPLLDFAVATVNGVGDKAFAHRPGLGWDWDVEMYRETLQKRVFFYRESKVEMKAGCKGTLKY